VKTYEVTATREGKWWMVAIPELDGLTQARRLAEVPEMAREYIAVTRNIPIEEVAVNVSYENVGAVTGIKSTLASIERYRTAAANLERSATRLSSQLVKSLSAEGVSVRDIGTILGLSFQRAQQLNSLEDDPDQSEQVSITPVDNHKAGILGLVTMNSLPRLPSGSGSWTLVVSHHTDDEWEVAEDVGGSVVAFHSD